MAEGVELPGAFVSAECLDRNLLFAVLFPSGRLEAFEGLPSEAFEGLWRSSEGLWRPSKTISGRFWRRFSSFFKVAQRG